MIFNNTLQVHILFQTMIKQFQMLRSVKPVLQHLIWTPFHLICQIKRNIYLGFRLLRVENFLPRALLSDLQNLLHIHLLFNSKPVIYFLILKSCLYSLKSNKACLKIPMTYLKFLPSHRNKTLLFSKHILWSSEALPLPKNLFDIKR